MTHDCLFSPGIRRRARTSAVLLLSKRGNISHGSVPPIGFKSNKRRQVSSGHSTWKQRYSKSRRRMASERQINRLFPGLIAINMIWEPISLTNRLAHQSTTSPTSGGSVELKPKTADLRVDHHLCLMRRLGIHKNIPVSDTRLTLGRRIYFISSHLTADKLFPVNPVHAFLIS